MIVRCTSCFTTYRVSDRLVTTPNPTFRCSRCKHVFVLEIKPQAKPDEDKLPSPLATPQEDEGNDRQLNLSFPFSQQPSASPKPLSEESPTPQEEAVGPPDQPAPQPEPVGPPDQPAPQPEAVGPPDQPAPQPETEDRGKQISAVLDSDHVPRTHTDWKVDSETVKGEENLALEEEQSESGTAVSQRRGSHLSVIPHIGLFGILIFIFSLVTLMYQARPTRLESLIKAIPWFGSLVFKNNHLQQGLVLRSLRSGFQTIPGGRKVFVISAEVVNRNPVSVREVRVEGHIYTAEGKEIGRQAISVGNAISSKIIRDMTAQEISILQRLSPQRSFEILPEKSAPFTIVFLKPTRNIKAFGCRVLSAKGAA